MKWESANLLLFVWISTVFMHITVLLGQLALLSYFRCVLQVNLKGEEMQLLPEKGMYWPAESTLLLADVHIGKAATFRKNFIHVPRGSTSLDLSLISDMIDQSGASKLLILGDFFHHQEGRSELTLSMLAGWRKIHKHLEIELIRGNHDLYAGDPPTALNIRMLDEPYHLGPFSFSHHPIPTIGKLYNLAGHIHPAIRLVGAARQSLRLPCFYFGKKAGLLPAFGSFTGHVEVKAEEGAEIYVIADGQVIAIPNP